jgi:hypothetical protein
MESPNKAFTQLRKKKVGPNRYNRIIKNRQSSGKRSKKKLKKRNSAIKKIDPGKPKKTRQFTRLIRNNLGQRKLMPLTSVIKRVLNLLLIASTNKNELDERRA